MTEIIAEIGINHIGSVELAKEMCKKSKDCGADVAKFQTYNVNDMDPSRPYYDVIKTAQLSRKEFRELKKYCDEIDIEFMSTPDNEKDLKFLVSLGVKRIKIASCQAKRNDDVIWAAFKTGLPVILAVGGLDLVEISNILRRVDEEYPDYRDENKLTFLYCVPEYPTPDEHTELKKMNLIKFCGFNVPVGFSDHSVGITASLMAIAMGATIVERHVTYDKTMISGPDHAASITFEELEELVKHKNRMDVIFGVENKEKLEINCKEEDGIIETIEEMIK